MKTRMFMISVFVIWAATTGCGVSTLASPIAGSGLLASEEREVADFTAIELTGSADVTVQTGKERSVRVEADDNLLDYIETRVVNGKLVIGTKPNVSLHPRLGIKVTVSVQELSAVKLSGSGNIELTGLDNSSIDFVLGGSGSITASGKTDQVAATINGSGNIFCKDLEARTAAAKITGSGNVAVNAVEKVDASISGSGNIQVLGNPQQLTKTIGGSGNIISVP